MDRFLHFKDTQCFKSHKREYQSQVYSDKKFFIIVFAISLFYTVLDIILYLSAFEREVGYIALMIAVIFQFMRLILFIFYLKHSSDSISKKFLLLERLFVVVFTAAAIATWYIQIDLDSSRIFVVGLDAAWTFLFVNTLFGEWTLKIVFYTSIYAFALIKQAVTDENFSLGPIQAFLQIGLIVLVAYIDERQKRLKLLKEISVEKTEQTLKSILNNIPENIAIINLEGELIFYNEYLDVSFNISKSKELEIFSEIYQIKPRERHVNLQKIQERYNFTKTPTKKIQANKLKKLGTNGKKSPVNSHLRKYLTQEFNLSNKTGHLFPKVKDQKKRGIHSVQLTPSKTLTEFFASIKYFADLQEVLDFFCVNVEILRTYSQKEKSFFVFDGKYNTKEGLVKSFEIKIVLSTFNDEDGLVIILRDTTHRDIIVTLEDNNNFKDSILASISHELRTPLNTNLNLLELAISTFESTDVMSDSVGSHGNMKRISQHHPLKETFLVPAHKSGKLLESVINDVLDYSMLIARKFVVKIKEQYLMKSLEKIRYLCEFQARKRNIEFHISLSQKLNYKVGTDHRRLRQILTNLLNNAIRFTTKGFVSLRIEPYNDNPDLVQFIIKDSGVGIPPDVLERMVAKLEKGNIMNKLNKEASGVGLGLTISHLLARELGPTSGRMSGIKIDSMEGQGSKFWFVIENWARSTEIYSETIKSKHSEIQFRKSYNSPVNNDLLKQDDFPGEFKLLPLSSFHHKDPMLRKITLLKDMPSPKTVGMDTPVSPENEAVLRQVDEVDEEIACMIKDDNLRLSMTTEGKLLKNDSRFPLFPSQISAFNSKVIGSDAQSALLNEKAKGKSEFPLKVSHIETLDVVRSHSAGPSRKDSLEHFKRACVCAEILVVDDDMFNLFTMESLIGNLGFKIAKANNGEEAIKFVKKRSEFKCSEQCSPFKLIFMDLSMPIMDGFQATLALKEMMNNGEIEQIPIVACTAFVDHERTEKCYEVGMVGRISKPVNKNKLREVLKKYGIEKGK